MITNHTQLLNALIEKYGLKSYLEIGVQNPANNFEKIKAESKTGVDPEITEKLTEDFWLCPLISDEYFSTNTGVVKYDLIFIDGLHHADQVKRDFENSLRCLSDNGYIVIHDVMPENEAGTIVPRETKQWWGDVYKFAMRIAEYEGIDYKTFDIDNGCMIVWKTGNKNDGQETDMSWVGYKTEWDWYLYHRKSYMNVTSTVEI